MHRKSRANSQLAICQFFPPPHQFLLQFFFDWRWRQRLNPSPVGVWEIPRVLSPFRVNCGSHVLLLLFCFFVVPAFLSFLPFLPDLISAVQWRVNESEGVSRNKEIRNSRFPGKKCTYKKKREERRAKASDCSCRYIQFPEGKKYMHWQAAQLGAVLFRIRGNFRGVNQNRWNWESRRSQTSFPYFELFRGDGKIEIPNILHFLLSFSEVGEKWGRKSNPFLWKKKEGDFEPLAFTAFDKNEDEIWERRRLPFQKEGKIRSAYLDVIALKIFLCWELIFIFLLSPFFVSGHAFEASEKGREKKGRSVSAPSVFYGRLEVWKEEFKPSFCDRGRSNFFAS